MKPATGGIAPPPTTSLSSKMADNNEFSDNCIFRRADKRLEEQLMSTNTTPSMMTKPTTHTAIKSHQQQQQQPQPQQYLSLDKELSLLLARRRLLQLQSLLENSTKSLHNIWLQADEMVAIDSFDMLRDESRSIEAKLADRFARQYATKCAVSSNLQLVQCDSCPEMPHPLPFAAPHPTRRQTECVQRLASCIETYPKLVSWLSVIGLPDAVIQVILEHTNSSMEKLLSLERHMLADIMRQRGGATEAEVERLLGACDRLATLIYKHCPEESRTFPLIFPLCSSSSSSSSTAASPLITASAIASAHHNNSNSNRRIPSESDLGNFAVGGHRNNFSYLSHSSMPVGPSDAKQQALFWDSWKHFVQQHRQQPKITSTNSTDNDESSSQEQPVMLMMDEFESSVSSLNNSNSVANAILQRNNAGVDTSTSSAFSSSSSPSLSSIPNAIAAFVASNIPPSSTSPPPPTSVYSVVSNNNTIHYVRTSELDSNAAVPGPNRATSVGCGVIPPPPPPISTLAHANDSNSSKFQQFPVDSNPNSNHSDLPQHYGVRNSPEHAPVRSTKFKPGIIPPPPPAKASSVANMMPKSGPALMQINPEAYQAHRASYSHIEDDLSTMAASSSSSAVQKSRSHEERLATANSDGNIAQHNTALGSKTPVSGQGTDNPSQNARYRLYSTGAISSSIGSTAPGHHHHQQKLHSASSTGGQTNNPSDGESESLGMMPEAYQARSMKHHIPHSFVFYCKPGATCSYCQRSFFIGQKCKHCKAKFHKDCAMKAPPTCGMTDELVASLQREFANMTVMASTANSSNANSDDSAFLSNSPQLDRGTAAAGGVPTSSSSSYNIASATSAYCTTALRKGAGRFRTRTQRAFSPFQIIAAAQAGAAAGAVAGGSTVDSSSASSCNSSAPASPAVIITPAAVEGGVKQFRFSAHDEEDEDDEKYEENAASASTVFDEPARPNNDVRRPSIPTEAPNLHERIGPTASNPPFNELVDTNMSTESDKTITQAPQDQPFSFSNSSRDYHLLSVSNDPSAEPQTTANNSLLSDSNEIADDGKGDENEEQQPEQADQFDNDYFLTRASVARQNSFAIRDLNIPFGQLKFKELVGIGTYGIVYRGYWHGDVAIKILNGKPTTPPTPTYDANGECIVNREAEENHHRIREQFKHELGTLRKTRHDNLVLFMGACMTPQHVIVTSFCNGPTLHALVHHHQHYPGTSSHNSKRSSHHKSHFSAGSVGGINRAILLAAQVCQGMDYLHHRGFVHRNLKSRNIFLANDKIIITDYGTFSVARMLATLPPLAPLAALGSGSGDAAVVSAQQPTEKKSSIYPKEWLYYLAPELCRRLNTYDPDTASEVVLPFAIQSDVYAFGTIWYELICGEYPLLWTQQSAETIIEQVGNGTQQISGCDIGAPAPPLPAPFTEQRELLELLNACWAHAPEMRPEFRELLKTLARIPQKPLSRSPSHPVHATSRT